MPRANWSTAALITALVAAVPDATQAQTLEPGTRVRVTLTSGGITLTGPLVAWRGDTITVGDNSGMFGYQEHTVTAPQVKSVERSVGRRSRPLAGAAIGGLVGAALGAMLGGAGSSAPRSCQKAPDLFSWISCGGENVANDRGVRQIGGASGGAMLGILAGGIIGAVSHTDVWKSVETPSLGVRTRVIVPNLRSAGVGVSIVF